MIAAQIKDGYVVQCIVGNSDWASEWLGGFWVNSQSKVGIGWTWNETDGFRPPRPFESWGWDGYFWNPPVSYPDDGEYYYWDENSLSWSVFQNLS